MKKTLLFTLLLFFFCTMQAQWVDDPASNTFIANCENSAAELYVAASPDGGTFVEWTSMSANGWSPKLQYLNQEGVPRWGRDGVHVTTPNLATWSPGYAIAATADGAVISMFRSADARHWVVKVNPDGSTPWGTDGMVLFNGEGGGRSELLAGDDGGFWALGTDMDNSFLQYVNADGSLRAMATITDPVKKCTNGKLIPADDGVFVVYSKHTIQGYSYYNKEIYVAKYNKDGEQIAPETLLFGLQTVGMSYIHYAIPDGMGGGYVYQWHNAIGSVYNIYVTHFDASGAPTITEPNGIPVHSPDPSHYYTSAYTTIDPLNHDLIIAYRQTDSGSQTQDMVWMNRITSQGEKPWNDGLAVTEAIGDYADIMVDAYEYGEGFAVIYYDGNNAIQSVGYDMEGNAVWNTTMSTASYPKAISENSTGFHYGQNIIAWANSSSGGVYGQNLGWDGTMGEITPPTPPTPPTPCDPPTNFHGQHQYIYPPGYNIVSFSWTAPEILPLHYNLYCDEAREVIEIEAWKTSYYGYMPYSAIFRLTAVYEDCESDYALTPDGDNFIHFFFVVTVPEIENEEIVTFINVYTLTGQRIRNANLEELNPGVYILQGLTADGKLVTRKVVVDGN